jgi:hypothetical protein
MSRIIELALSVLIVAVLFVLVGVILPSHAHVERTTELANPVAQVYDVLNGFRRYNAWQPWVPMDPLAKYTREGPDFGVGARLGWTSFEKIMGNGTLEIVETKPGESITMNMVNDWYGTNKVFVYKLETNQQTRATNVTWSLDIDYGWDLFGRYAGLYLNGSVGELMSSGLSRLANLMATMPIFDYSQAEIQLLDVEPVDIVAVGATVPAAPRKWEEAETVMSKAWTEVEAFIKKNKLTPVGPSRRITNVLGEDNNDYNMAIPVQPTEVGEGGGVHLGKSYGGKALMTEFHGQRVAMGKPRDMLKAYAMTHGYRFDGNMEGTWEEWLPDDDAQGLSVTRLYLPVTL